MLMLIATFSIFILSGLIIAQFVMTLGMRTRLTKVETVLKHIEDDRVDRLLLD